MKKKMNSKLIAITFLITLSFTQCKEENTKEVNTNDQTTIKNDSLAFGDTKFISNGLMGKVYLLPIGTSKLPDFDTMHVQSTLYTNELNIPNRSWVSGFPGLPNRFEWFGIEYTGSFRAIKNGHYKFRLVSDDGSKLFIDDSLVINNDGGHGAISVAGEFDLDGSEHSIKVQYFQGPRFAIALQLFANLEKEDEQPFPRKYFELNTLPSNSFLHSNSIYIIGGILLLILLIIAYRIATRKKRSAKQIK